MGLVGNDKKNNANYIRRYWQLYLMLAIPILYFAIFKYGAMYGVIIAFKDYNIFAGINDSPWIGFDLFKEVFAAKEFYIALKNTLILNLGDLILGFPAPIIFALLLNELINERFQRFVQTVLYIPHFLSWVIIAGMAYQFFATRGIANSFLASLGGQPFNFLGANIPWIVVYWMVGIWHSAGWGSIIYLASLTSIDPALYEAACVDGAGRFRRMWSITLPSIKNTISILLIMNLGKIVNIGFERPFLMGNVLVQDVSKVISTYVYQVGLGSGRFNFATAVGLFQSIVGLTLLLIVDRLAKKMGNEGVV